MRCVYTVSLCRPCASTRTSTCTVYTCRCWACTRALYWPYALSTVRVPAPLYSVHLQVLGLYRGTVLALCTVHCTSTCTPVHLQVLGLYRGTVPALAAIVAENSLLFMAYGATQRAMARAVGVEEVQCTTWVSAISHSHISNRCLLTSTSSGIKKLSYVSWLSCVTCVMCVMAVLCDIFVLFVMGFLCVMCVLCVLCVMCVMRVMCAMCVMTVMCVTCVMRVMCAMNFLCVMF